ncbi:hypothetical protein niasHS_009641 [Heterodera schachtii]|uniref:BTB domain-containing protein n=1 Tax=Heterodera schachtii TaxID=97005 RepID=A0ABD2J4X7_HETSC
MSKVCPVAERMRWLLLTGEGADVRFLVGDEKEEFSAHKAILLASSDVFKAMFRFDEQNAMKEANPTPPGAKRAKKPKIVIVTGGRASSGVMLAGDGVVIPDVTVEAFKAMLEFIYTDDLSGLNGDNLFDVLYAAKKYQINLLIDACADFPVSNVQNIFTAFLRARFFGEEAFACRCLDNINFNNDLTMQQFLKANNQLLCEILDNLPQKPSGEIAIWNAALRWSDEQCAKNGKECTGENRREMLGPALYKIRFPLISLNDFSNRIVPSDVLTKDEMLSVFMSYSRTAAAVHATAGPSLLPAPYPLHFPTDQRMAVQNFSSAAQQKGRLTLKIGKFSDFSRGGESAATGRHSDAVNIRGFSFKFMANIYTMRADKSKKCLGFFIECNKNEPNWCCTCSATMQIVVQKKCKYYSSYIKQFADNNFSAENNKLGTVEFISIEQLMNPDNGWYNEKDDSVILVAELSPYAPAYPSSLSPQKRL